VFARIEKSKICGTIFSRVCTESNFGLFTFVSLHHRSSVYRDLHTSHIVSNEVKLNPRGGVVGR